MKKKISGEEQENLSKGEGQLCIEEENETITCEVKDVRKWFKDEDANILCSSNWLMWFGSKESIVCS